MKLKINERIQDYVHKIVYVYSPDVIVSDSELNYDENLQGYFIDVKQKYNVIAPEDIDMESHDSIINQLLNKTNLQHIDPGNIVTAAIYSHTGNVVNDVVIDVRPYTKIPEIIIDNVLNEIYNIYKHGL